MWHRSLTIWKLRSDPSGVTSVGGQWNDLDSDHRSASSHFRGSQTEDQGFLQSLKFLVESTDRLPNLSDRTGALRNDVGRTVNSMSTRIFRRVFVYIHLIPVPWSSVKIWPNISRQAATPTCKQAAKYLNRCLSSFAGKYAVHRQADATVRINFEFRVALNSCPCVCDCI